MYQLVLWCGHLWLVSPPQTPDTRHLHICNQTLILLPAALIRIHTYIVQEYFKIMINTNWSQHRGTEPVTISNLCSWSLSMTRAMRSSVTRLRILRSPAIGETFLEHDTGDRVRNVDTEWWPHIGTRLLTLTSDHGVIRTYLIQWIDLCHVMDWIGYQLSALVIDF